MILLLGPINKSPSVYVLSLGVKAMDLVCGYHNEEQLRFMILTSLLVDMSASDSRRESDALNH